MKHLRLFETETDYDGEVSEFEYPTVSLVQDVEDVRYMLKPPHDYSQDYLTFEALEDGTFTLTVPASVDSTCMTSVSYSTDNGATWTDTTIDNTAQTITTPTINAGDKVLWKGVGKQTSKNQQYSSPIFSKFSSIGNFNVSGNIMSLLYGEDFVGRNVLPSDSEVNFAGLFGGSRTLINAINLILPSMELTTRTYNYMFRNCTSLTTAPELPATTLVGSCYNEMFENCSNLNYIKAMFTTTPSSSYTSNWVKGVASTGTFVKNSAATWNVTGNNGVPAGWTVETASE